MVIFDFDMTLVDSSAVEPLRKARKWREVMSRLDRIEVYPGVDELLTDLEAAGRTCAIVTTSPDMVPKAFIKSRKWPVEVVVGFHDVGGLSKPHPRGLQLALHRAGVDAACAVHVGDQATDTAAAKAAGVRAIGVTWGLDDPAELAASEPNELFATVAELRAYLLGPRRPPSH